MIILKGLPQKNPHDDSVAGNFLQLGHQSRSSASPIENDFKRWGVNTDGMDAYAKGGRIKPRGSRLKSSGGQKQKQSQNTHINIKIGDVRKRRANNNKVAKSQVPRVITQLVSAPSAPSSTPNFPTNLNELLARTGRLEQILMLDRPKQTKLDDITAREPTERHSSQAISSASGLTSPTGFQGPQQITSSGLKSFGSSTDYGDVMPFASASSASLSQFAPDVASSSAVLSEMRFPASGGPGSGKEEAIEDHDEPAHAPPSQELNKYLKTSASFNGSPIYTNLKKNVLYVHRAGVMHNLLTLLKPTNKSYAPLVQSLVSKGEFNPKLSRDQKTVKEAEAFLFPSSTDDLMHMMQNDLQGAYGSGSFLPKK
jgi:hypothetical protein